MSDRLIIRAAVFAEQAHQTQIRKYTQRPYIEHPGRVAAAATLLPNTTPHIIAAAWLHDVAEDCGVKFKVLEAEFGSRVMELVHELTNVSKGQVGLTREERKRLDREHLSHASYWARAIKFLDRIDNLQELRGAILQANDAAIAFAGIYLPESRLLATAIRQDDLSMELLYTRLMTTIDELQQVVAS